MLQHRDKDLVTCFDLCGQPIGDKIDRLGRPLGEDDEAGARPRARGLHAGRRAARASVAEPAEQAQGLFEWLVVLGHRRAIVRCPKQFQLALPRLRELQGRHR